MKNKTIRAKIILSTIVFTLGVAGVSLSVVYYWSFYHFSKIFEDRVIDEYTFEKKKDMGIKNEWILGVTTDSIDVIRSVHGPNVARTMEEQAKHQEELSKLYKATIDNKHLLYNIHLDTENGETVYEYSVIKDIYAEIFPKIVLSFIVFLSLLVWFSIYYTRSISDTLYSDIRKLRLYTQQITKGKQAPEIVAKTQDEELEYLIADLHEMQQHLEREAAIRQSTLQYISHEMKTPLMIIEGYTTSAQDGIYPKGDLDSSLQTILTQTDRMKRKVADLLTIVRLESSSVPDNTKEIALLPAINSVLQLFETKEADKTIHVHVPAQIAFVGSQEKLNILLENLISNQIKYAQSLISISYKIQDTDLLLYFYNDGQTITPEIQDFIFQPFVKGYNGGSGLGLSICRTILRQKDCDIRWEPTTYGTLFVVQICEKHWCYIDT